MAETRTQDAGEAGGGALALPTVRGIGKTIGTRGGVVLAFLVMILIFSLARPSEFASVDTTKSILTNAAPTMIVALGLTIVLAMGDFDLSIGSMVGLAAGAAVHL